LNNVIHPLFIDFFFSKLKLIPSFSFSSSLHFLFLIFSYLSYLFYLSSLSLGLKLNHHLFFFFKKKEVKEEEEEES